jgi:eukaryotic-like serine/threonine-protein kinase
VTPERWKQIDMVYQEALRRVAGERASFLAEVCQNDQEMRREVDTLLEFQEKTDGFMEAPACDMVARMIRQPPDEWSNDCMGVAHEALSTGTRLGPYEILSRLGAGGMGEVYKARDPRIGRDVAIKVLRPDFSSDSDRLRRFEQEIRAAGALNHPNILSIYDVGHHDGSPYIVSELLEGETLRECLRRGALSRRKAVEYAVQIARGLGAEHQRGTTHRDLKPENLFITTDGRAKILDFGLAKLTRGQAEERSEGGMSITGETLPGTVLGTVGYMSPEQARGEEVDHRSDIFSLGTVLYEMLLGHRAFTGESAVEILHAILKEEPPLPAELEREAPALVRIVRHCLEKSPQERFQSAFDLAFDLAALSSLQESVAPTVGVSRAKRTLRGAAVVALAVVATATLTWTSTSRWIASRQSSPIFHQLTFGRGAPLDARFSADGQTVYYDAALDGKPIEIFSTRAERPESSAFFSHAPSPQNGLRAVSSTGEMAFSQECTPVYGSCTLGTLARVPISGGAPREILDQVDIADWTPDGNELAVVRKSAKGLYRLELPIENVLYETPGSIGEIRISPNGNLIAFTDHPILGGALRHGSIAVVDLQGHKENLTEGWSEIRGLAWHSAEEIWFTAGTAKSMSLWGVTLSKRVRLIFRAPGSIHLQDISHDGRVLLKRGDYTLRITALPPGGKERNLSWFDSSWLADLSRDGNTILFSELGEGVAAVPTVYLRRTDGSDAKKLGVGTAMALSPDGKWALAMRPGQLVLLPAGTGEEKPLPRGDLVEFYDALAAWFPDGNRIMFAGETSDHHNRSYVQKIDTGEIRPLAPPGWLARLVSPDGKRVVVQDGDSGTFYIYPVDASKPGAMPEPIRGLDPEDTPLQWSADGRSLYVRKPAVPVLDLYRLDLASGRLAPWKKLAPADPTGVLNILLTGARVTPDGKSWAYTHAIQAGELYLVEGLR